MSNWKRMILAGAVALSCAMPLAAAITPAQAQSVVVRGIGPVTAETFNVRVVSVDRASRNVVVERRGRQWRIIVPEAFGSLAAVRRRDRLEISRIEGVLLSVTRGNRNARPDISVNETANDGTFQDLPARWVTRSVTVTARFTGFNAATGVVSYTGPEGPRTIRAVDPALTETLRTLKSGDMINLTFAEATQIVLTPRRL